MIRRSVAVLVATLTLSAAMTVFAQSGAQTSINARGDGEDSAIGFNTVAEALAGLSAREGVSIRKNKDGWTEIEDGQKNVLWSFVPEGHPAYPAAVRRTVSGRGLAVAIGMDGLCEAERSACEALMKDLQKRNEVARTNFIRKPPRGAAAKADVTPIGSLLSR
jgi:hypothetical protein